LLNIYIKRGTYNFNFVVFALEEVLEALFGEAVVVGARLEAFFELEDVSRREVAERLEVLEGLRGALELRLVGSHLFK
jgi:hypothetical protein